MRARVALALIILLTAKSALGQIQISAQWDLQTPEQQAAALNPQALASSIASQMGPVYEAAGLPANTGGGVTVSGALIGNPAAPPPGPAPPSTPRPPSPPPPPGVVKESDSDNTGLVVAALAIGLVGLVGVAGWYCLRKPSAAKIALPPEIPYKIRPPQPGPQKYAPIPTQPEPQYYAPVPPPPGYYAPAPPQQPGYYAPPPPQQPGYYAPPQPPPQPHGYYVPGDSNQPQRKVWVPV